MRILLPARVFGGSIPYLVIMLRAKNICTRYYSEADHKAQWPFTFDLLEAAKAVIQPTRLLTWQAQSLFDYLQNSHEEFYQNKKKKETMQANSKRFFQGVAIWALHTFG